MAGRSAWLKYSVLVLGIVLWAFGLADQFHSSEATMKYLALTLLIAAIAVV
jgi:hypothetical protein